jgi:hypothetical protein
MRKTKEEGGWTREDRPCAREEGRVHMLAQTLAVAGDSAIAAAPEYPRTGAHVIASCSQPLVHEGGRQ